MKTKFTFYIMVVILTLTACQEKKYYAVIETDYGTMKAELYNSTPIHRDNFIKIANEGYYTDLLFHRVISGFMIQGGDPDSKNAPAGQRLGMGGPGYTLQAEIGAPHFKGTLAAARTGGSSNPEKRSSGSQFYVVQGTRQSRNALQSIASQKGITYNEEQIAKYEQLGGTPMLDMDYTVFGEVVEGLDVVDKIASVQTDNADRPLQDVKMKIRITTR